MAECNGPCLKHCYSHNNLKMLLLGLILGYCFAYYIVETNKQKSK